MINANELRLGNCVLDNEGNPKEVTADVFREITEYCDMDLYSPIPLTPEILEKAGFEESRQTFFTWYILGFMEKQFRLDYSAESEYHWVQGHTSVQLNYVHQLQNLYFALTGTELEINLNP